jgi:hypothetical protein
MTPFGAASANHCATATGLHANEKTMGALAANDGGLVSAFHDPEACINKERSNP